MVGTRFAQKVQVGTTVKTALGSFVGFLAVLAIQSSTGWFSSQTSQIGLIATCNAGSCATIVTVVVDCTATGGLVKYNFCQWQEPDDDYGSGSIIHRLSFENGDVPAAGGGDATIGISATVSGAISITNLTDMTFGTGATFVYSTGSLVITKNDYLRIITLQDQTSSHTSRLTIQYSPKIDETD